MNVNDFENRSVDSDLPLFPIKVLSEVLPFAYSTLRGYVRRYKEKGIEVCSKGGPVGTPGYYLFSIKQVGMYIYRTDKTGPPEYKADENTFPQEIDYAEIGFNALLGNREKLQGYACQLV